MSEDSKYTDLDQEKLKSKPHLICSECKAAVSLDRGCGMLHDSYISCKCRAIFQCGALSKWYEDGRERGMRQIQEKFREILNID